MTGSDAPQDAGAEPGDRLIDRLISGFESRHQSVTNRMIQFIAVPVMMWAGYGLLRSAPEPGLLAAIPLVDWAVLVAILVSLGYWALSPRVGAAIGLLSLFLILVGAVYGSNESLPLWQPAIVFLVLSGLLWLVGRRIEGRPRLLGEMALDLLTGPAWIATRLLRLAGISY